MSASWAAVIIAAVAIITDRLATARRSARDANDRARETGERDGRLAEILDELRRIATDHEQRIRALQRTRR